MGVDDPAGVFMRILDTHGFFQFPRYDSNGFHKLSIIESRIADSSMFGRLHGIYAAAALNTTVNVIQSISANKAIILSAVNKSYGFLRIHK